MRRFTENTIRLFIDKLKLDLIYVSNYSILMDIHLIFLTLKIIFYQRQYRGCLKRL